MKRLFNLFRSTFFLYGAQIASLLLGWGVARLNVTYLSVDEYGQFNFFITIVNVSFIFFTLGLFEASSRLLAVSEKPTDSRRMISASLLSTLIAYVIFTLFLLFANPHFHLFFAVDISVLMNLFFPLAGIYLLYDFWQKILRGTGKIFQLSWFLVLPRVLYFLFLVLLVYFQQFGLSQSVLFNLVSFAVIFLLYLVWEPLDFSNIRESLTRLLREVRRYGLHMYGAELIQALLFHLDKLLIAYFLDAEQLAYYSLAFTITMPLTLFSNSLSTAHYRRFTREMVIDRKILLLNLLWVIISLVLLVFFGSWIVEFLFSEKYSYSTPVLIPLALAFGISGQSKIFSYYLAARGEGKIIRNISIAILAVNMAGYLILIPWMGIMGAAYCRIITFGVDLTLTFYKYRAVSKNRHDRNNR